MRRLNITRADPLVLATRPKREESPARSPATARDESPEKVERRMREESIRTNRRRKFVDCLSSPDVEICECTSVAARKISPSAVISHSAQARMGRDP